MKLDAVQIRKTLHKCSSTVVIFGLTLITAACAGTPDPVALLPTKPGTRIQLVVHGSQEHGGANSQNIIVSRAKQGGKIGFGTGAMVGIPCGPAFLVCSTVFGIGGGILGLVYGTYAGVVETAIRQLPKEKADAFNSILSQITENEEMSSSLQEGFVDATDGKFPIVTEEPDMQVLIGISDLSFKQHLKDEMTFRVTGSMLVLYGDSEEKITEAQDFTYTSDRRHIDEWLDDDGKKFTDELNRLIKSISEEMVRTLELGEEVDP